MENGQTYVGVGVGASRIKIVCDSGDFRAPRVLLQDHLGNPKEVITGLLMQIDPRSVSGLAVTGGDGASLFTGRKICECEAIEESLRLLDLKANAILSLGGESFVAYPLDSRGRIMDYVSGNRCAAGTVEFFKQQLGRMNLGIEEALRVAGSGKVVPLAKRCSVHCKSDCTHALNKSRCSVADIVHTLCHNMAEKAAGLLRNSRFDKGRLLVIGGAASNPVIVDYLRNFLPDCEIIVPAESAYFEALGAASMARRISLPLPSNGDWSGIFRETSVSFAHLDPLDKYADMVTFIPGKRARVKPDGRYLLGIDGGSTTTKAALIDFDSLEICASLYLRTNGNPERAMKECLAGVLEQVRETVPDANINIVGTATTGSSGEILSVLCETPAYHNEIIAHAYGASYFCPEVDTIFEIGGQDSKYTSLKSRVAVDFNMNESCSAGTGSFIEESAKDDLGVSMEQIAELALKSRKPPRFSDQCAAFANTDIRKAFQEGATREDNLAGLVYAIVENYVSKVVGKRKIGDHILFQGGTSKNRAIAHAFAAKTGKHITVPPDSELIGCFGIALWLREKILSGEMPERQSNLEEMLASVVSETREFTCKACSNFCTIRNLTVNRTRYPFGGQCSKWENARQSRTVEANDFDFVEKRNRMLFDEFGVAPLASGTHTDKPTIGLQAVFSVYALYPLYSTFFNRLGYDIVLSETVDPRGVQMCQSARCYPYEIAHGTFYDLVEKGVHRIFAPHLVGMPHDGAAVASLSCPIAQGLPYYLAAAFPGKHFKLYDPVLHLSGGIRSVEKAFVGLGAALGHPAELASRAFRDACETQEAFEKAVSEEGRRILEWLEKENKTAVVLVGRPYNAFSKTANMGVPRKFASHGVAIIPFEFLPHEAEDVERTMYWSYGRLILKSLKYVKRHPRLFPVYISNFGCGPDSFIQHFAGFTMGSKPMLYLELDSHTADAGIGTRVAAFLDILSGYSRLGEKEPAARDFEQAEFMMVDGKPFVRSSAGELVSAHDPRVTLVFPSMGRMNTEAGAAAARTTGFNAIAMPPVDDRVRALGKCFTSGKECSPAVFTIGALMDYCNRLHKKKRDDEIMLFFMPTADGPCRFGQYNVYMKALVNMLGIEDVAVFSISAANGYGGVGVRFLMSAWQCFVISDVMRDIRSVLNVLAQDKPDALRRFDEEWQKLLKAMAQGYGATWRALKKAAVALSEIRIDGNPRELPKVLLTGEIYVRSDELSRRGIEDAYADEGIMVKIADSTEWVYYTDWHYLNRISGNGEAGHNALSRKAFKKHLALAMLRGNRTSRAFVRGRLKLWFERRVDSKIRRILARSGLVPLTPHDIEDIVGTGSFFMRPALAGEAILTAGSAKLAFEDHSSDNFCGIILIGPFNCMPTGVAESVMKPYARKHGIPYLTFETDGGPLPPNLRSQIEVHILRSRIYAAEHVPDHALPPAGRANFPPW